jgi:hypothetical protein
MANFVVTPSPFDAFQRQVVFNNHPLFSFAEHLIYSATALHSEAAMRVLPDALGAIAVGTLVGSLAWILGLLPSLAGGLVLATNPIFVAATRDVRGYSLMTLMVLVASLLVVRMSRSPSHEGGAGMGRTYMASIGVAVGTHFYAVLALPAHLAYLVAKRQLTTSWCLRVATAAVLGLVPYTLLLSGMFIAGGRKGFRPQFPVELAGDLLGRSIWSALVLGLVVAVGAYRLRSWLVLILVAMSILVPLAFVWIVVQPADLFSRFLVWLVPGVGLLVAVAVAWRPAFAALVLAACIFSWLSATAPTYTSDFIANRAAASVIDATAAKGQTACAAGFSSETLPIYTRHFLSLSSTAQLSQCDLVIVLEPDEPSHRAWLQAASEQFPLHRELPAQTPGVLLTRSR